MFLKVMDGLLVAPGPKGWAPALLLPASPAMAVCFAGETTERSKGPELLLFCLPGQTSSLGPGVAGVNTGPPATNKLFYFWKHLSRNKIKHSPWPHNFHCCSITVVAMRVTTMLMVVIVMMMGLWLTMVAEVVVVIWCHFLHCFHYII